MTNYRIREAAAMLGVSQTTLRRWEAEGKLTPIKTFGGHRLYSEELLQTILGQNKETPKTGKTVVYARVSSAGQKTDLKNQIRALEEFAGARGLVIDEISEIGGDMNSTKFNQILNDMPDSKISILVITQQGSVG